MIGGDMYEFPDGTVGSNAGDCAQAWADEARGLRAEVEELKVIISQWYSVYTDDMQPDGDLLADTDAVLRGEGEK